MPGLLKILLVLDLVRKGLSLLFRKSSPDVSEEVPKRNIPVKRKSRAK